MSDFVVGQRVITKPAQPMVHGGGPVSTPVARLADALKAADDKNPADNERDHYLWLAHAAIEALQLTEEARTVRSICDMADLGIDERRLVGPWRTA